MTKKMFPIILLVLAGVFLFSMSSFAQLDALKKNLGKFVEDPTGAVKKTSLSDYRDRSGYQRSSKGWYNQCCFIGR